MKESLSALCHYSFLSLIHLRWSSVPIMLVAFSPAMEPQSFIYLHGKQSVADISDEEDLVGCTSTCSGETNSAKWLEN